MIGLSSSQCSSSDVLIAIAEVWGISAFSLDDHVQRSGFVYCQGRQGQNRESPFLVLMGRV